MKRSEFLAWSSLTALLAIAIVLLIGGVQYNTNFFWAGMCLALGQSLVVGLAGWGLRLARQRAELEEISPTGAVHGFRMSFSEESTPAAARKPEAELKTLDTSFQRLVVGLAATFLLSLAAFIAWYLIYRTFGWSKLHIDQPFPIAGSFDAPKPLDELALLIALASSAAYAVFYWITRPRPESHATDDAVNSNFTLGLPAMIALGVAGLCAYLNVTYASEIAASITVALLTLQGLELLLSCFRSYSAIEELDQPAVDLQAMPLIPMLSSTWLSGVKLLFAQSVGLSDGKDRSVLARLLPRTLIACLLIAIFISCLRTVPAGRVAVLERLGTARTHPDHTLALLKPGLHFTLPWPIDRLVTIPTEELQLTDVGVELHGDKSIAAEGDTKLQQTVDFQFWTFRPNTLNTATETESQFVTGDPGSQQILETYVMVLWRVSDPVQLYNGLSHSEFVEKKEGEETATTAKPIYAELVQQCTSFAVTRTFATHTLDQIMTLQRGEVEADCLKILQKKLDDTHSGIHVVSLNITDLHPPLGEGNKSLDPTFPVGSGGPPLGPANAYEYIVNMMQYREVQIQEGLAKKDTAEYKAKGDAATEINDASIYKARRIADAKGEAIRIQTMLDRFNNLPPAEKHFMESLAEHQAMYSTFKDVFKPVNKIIVDPRVKNVDLYQMSDKAPGQFRPPTP